MLICTEITQSEKQHQDQSKAQHEDPQPSRLQPDPNAPQTAAQSKASTEAEKKVEQLKEEKKSEPIDVDDIPEPSKEAHRNTEPEKDGDK